jgi:hypothetical protein
MAGFFQKKSTSCASWPWWFKLLAWSGVQAVGGGFEANLQITER